MLIVRLFLFFVIATIAVAGLLYLFKRDRRYLRFIAQVIKYSILLFAGIMLLYLFERLILVL